MGNISTRNSTARLQDVFFPCGLLNSELTNMAMGLAVITTCKKVLYADLLDHRSLGCPTGNVGGPEQHDCHDWRD